MKATTAVKPTCNKDATITPKMAETWLKEHNKRIESGAFRNRPISQTRYEQYAADMRNGHWVFNHQGIAFDTNGNLQDGQHRLWAVKLSGIAIKTPVWTNMPVDYSNGIVLNTIDTIDRGRMRSIASQLAIDGFRYAALQAGIAKAIAMLCANNHHIPLSTAQTKQILAMFSKSLRAVFRPLQKLNRNMQPKVLAPVIFLHQCKPTECEDFIRKYDTLENLPNKSPVLALHKHFLQNPTCGGVDRLQRLKATACALKYHCEGQPVQLIRRSNEAAMWLLEQNKAAVRRVCALVESPERKRSQL